MKWMDYNPNPKGRRVEDCAVRAVAKALEMPWRDVYIMIAAQGLADGDMMHSDAVWGRVLANHGFKRFAVPNRCPDCYTAEDFAADHPQGTYVLGFGGHTATIKNGILYDAWDSLSLVPQYYWYRRY